MSKMATPRPFAHRSNPPAALRVQPLPVGHGDNNLRYVAASLGNQSFWLNYSGGIYTLSTENNPSFFAGPHGPTKHVLGVLAAEGPLRAKPPETDFGAAALHWMAYATLNAISQPEPRMTSGYVSALTSIVHETWKHPRGVPTLGCLKRLHLLLIRCLGMADTVALFRLLEKTRTFVDGKRSGIVDDLLDALQRRIHSLSEAVLLAASGATHVNIALPLTSLEQAAAFACLDRTLASVSPAENVLKAALLRLLATSKMNISEVHVARRAGIDVRLQNIKDAPCAGDFCESYWGVSGADNERCLEIFSAMRLGIPMPKHFQDLVRQSSPEVLRLVLTSADAVPHHIAQSQLLFIAQERPEIGSSLAEPCGRILAVSQVNSLTPNLINLVVRAWIEAKSDEKLAGLFTHRTGHILSAAKASAIHRRKASVTSNPDGLLDDADHKLAEQWPGEPSRMRLARAAEKWVAQCERSAGRTTEDVSLKQIQADGGDQWQSYDLVVRTGQAEELVDVKSGVRIGEGRFAHLLVKEKSTKRRSIDYAGVVVTRSKGSVEADTIAYIGRNSKEDRDRLEKLRGVFGSEVALSDIDSPAKQMWLNEWLFDFRRGGLDLLISDPLDALLLGSITDQCRDPALPTATDVRLTA